MAEKMTHEELSYQHALGHHELLHAEALGYVGLTFKRMIARGLMAQEQIDEELRQEANLAALEACHTWQPFISTLGSWVEIKVRSAVQDYLLALRSGMVGGYRSGYPVVSVEVPLHQTEPDDPATVGDMLSYADPPEGLGNPFDEVVCLQEQELARRAVARLAPADRELVRALFGIGQLQETQREFSLRTGVPLRSIERRWAYLRNKMAGFV